MHADLIARIEQHIRKLDAYQWEGAADVDPLPILTEAATAILELVAEVERLKAMQAADTETLMDALETSAANWSRAEAAEAKMAEIHRIAIDRKTVAIGGKEALYEAELAAIATLSAHQPAEEKNP